MTNYKDELTPEQLEKARACKSSDELVQLAKEEGVELNDEQLEGIAGGTWYDCMNDGAIGQSGESPFDLPERQRLDSRIFGV